MGNSKTKFRQSCNIVDSIHDIEGRPSNSASPSEQLFVKLRGKGTVEEEEEEEEEEEADGASHSRRRHDKYFVKMWFTKDTVIRFKGQQSKIDLKLQKQALKETGDILPAHKQKKKGKEEKEAEEEEETEEEEEEEIKMETKEDQEREKDRMYPTFKLLEIEGLDYEKKVYETDIARISSWEMSPNFFSSVGTSTNCPISKVRTIIVKDFVRRNKGGTLSKTELEKQMDYNLARNLWYMWKNLDGRPSLFDPKDENEEKEEAKFVAKGEQRIADASLENGKEEANRERAKEANRAKRRAKKREQAAQTRMQLFKKLLAFGKFNMIVLKAFPPGSMSLHDWIFTYQPKKIKSKPEILEVLFQILQIWATCEVIELEHRDMHNTNLTVSPNREGHMVTYILFGQTYQFVPTWIVRVYDWDRAKSKTVFAESGIRNPWNNIHPLPYDQRIGRMERLVEKLQEADDTLTATGKGEGGGGGWVNDFGGMWLGLVTNSEDVRVAIDAVGQLLMHLNHNRFYPIAPNGDGVYVLQDGFSTGNDDKEYVRRKRKAQIKKSIQQQEDDEIARSNRARALQVEMEQEQANEQKKRQAKKQQQREEEEEEEMRRRRGAEMEEDAEDKKEAENDAGKEEENEDKFYNRPAKLALAEARHRLLKRKFEATHRGAIYPMQRDT